MSFHQDIIFVHEMVDSINIFLLDLDYIRTTEDSVLDSSHREGWLSLNRQLKLALESGAESQSIRSMAQTTV
jgi:hypothetical protein